MGSGERDRHRFAQAEDLDPGADHRDLQRLRTVGVEAERLARDGRHVVTAGGDEHPVAETRVVELVSYNFV